MFMKDNSMKLLGKGRVGSSFQHELGEDQINKYWCVHILELPYLVAEVG